MPENVVVSPTEIWVFSMDFFFSFGIISFLQVERFCLWTLYLTSLWASPSEGCTLSLLGYGELLSSAVTSLSRSETSVQPVWVYHPNSNAKAFHSAVPCLRVFSSTRVGFSHRSASLRNGFQQFLPFFFAVRLWHLQDQWSRSPQQCVHLRSEQHKSWAAPSWIPLESWLAESGLSWAFTLSYDNPFMWAQCKRKGLSPVLTMSLLQHWRYLKALCIGVDYAQNFFLFCFRYAHKF